MTPKTDALIAAQIEAATAAIRVGLPVATICPSFDLSVQDYLRLSDRAQSPRQSAHAELKRTLRCAMYEATAMAARQAADALDEQDALIDALLTLLLEQAGRYEALSTTDFVDHSLTRIAAMREAELYPEPPLPDVQLANGGACS